MKNILVVVWAVCFLTACTYSKEHPPTEHHAVCSEIKNNLTFTGDVQYGEVDWSSPGQKAQLLREYKKYDCNNKS